MELLSMCIMLICYDRNGDEFMQQIPGKEYEKVIIHEKDIGARTAELNYETRYRISDYMGNTKDTETRLNCYEQ